MKWHQQGRGVRRRPDDAVDTAVPAAATHRGRRPVRRRLRNHRHVRTVAVIVVPPPRQPQEGSGPGPDWGGPCGDRRHRSCGLPARQSPPPSSIARTYRLVGMLVKPPGGQPSHAAGPGGPRRMAGDRKARDAGTLRCSPSRGQPRRAVPAPPRRKGRTPANIPSLAASSSCRGVGKARDEQRHGEPGAGQEGADRQGKARSDLAPDLPGGA